MALDVKDFMEELVRWWKVDKVTSTLSPILIIMNVMKLQSGSPYSFTELIANGIMLLLMMFSIRSYYKRVNDTNKLKYSLERYKTDMDLRFRELDHRKDIDDFAMSIVERQRKYQFGLITRKATFIHKQVEDNVNSIIHLSRSFNLQENPAILELIDMHIAAIHRLRDDLEALPADIEKTYHQFYHNDNSTVDLNSKNVNIIRNEIDTVIDEITSNIHLKEAKEDISGAIYVPEPNPAALA